MLEQLKDKISSAVKIEMYDTDNHWYRTEGNEWKPSVTTIINSVLNKGKGFETWLGNQPSYKIACEERDDAAARGTAVHEACEAYLHGQHVDGSNSPWGDEFNKRMMSFEAWMDEYKPDIIATEYKMYHKDIPFSGTCDMVIYTPDTGLSVVDIKTGAPYESHALQLTCYKMLWDAMYPDFPIKNMYGLYLKGTWISKVEPQFKSYKYVPEVMDHVLGVWRWLIGSTGPKGRKPIKTHFKLNKRVAEELNL